MTPQDQKPSVQAASEVAVDHASLNASIVEFAGHNGAYYARAFGKLYEAKRAGLSQFNIGACVFGPGWAAARGLWGMFWSFLILEIIAWIQIGRGLWGAPGADFLMRAQAQQERAQSFLDRATQATANGEDPSRFQQLVENLTSAAATSTAQGELANTGALSILAMGCALLLGFKIFQGIAGNVLYERQFSRWRIDKDAVTNGLQGANIAFGLALILLIAPLTIYQVTTTGGSEVLSTFPEKEVSSYFIADDKATLFTTIAAWLENRIDAAAVAGSDTFDGITQAIRSVLDALKVALVGTPWPVVMLIVLVCAWRSAGPRVAVFTSASMAYIALLGYWAIAMETVALAGAAVLICVTIGIPLGIWFGKSQRAYNTAEPVLDLMQTLPAFVYLIPIIAFFGTGNPPVS